mgnify:FL=1
MTIGLRRELPNGQIVIDTEMYVINYHELSEVNKTLFDTIFKNAAVLLASKIIAPDMIPDAFSLNRDEDMGSLVRSLVESFGKYKMKPEFNYYVTVHPKLTEQFTIVFHFCLVEVDPTANVVTDDDIRSNTYIVFEDVKDILQTDFKQQFEAAIANIEETFGKEQGALIRMVNSTDYVTSLAAMIASRDLFYTLSFMIEE